MTSSNTFSAKRKVNDKSYLFRSNRKSIAEEPNIKLLGVNFDQNLTWPSHVNSIVKASYEILRTSKTFKHFTPFKAHKSLAESLLLSKLNYSNVVFGQVPKYQSIFKTVYNVYKIVQLAMSSVDKTDVVTS